MKPSTLEAGQFMGFMTDMEMKLNNSYIELIVTQGVINVTDYLLKYRRDLFKKQMVLLSLITRT